MLANLTDDSMLPSNASTFNVGMMKLMRGKFSESDGTAELWLTAWTNSNQLCADDLCVRIAASQKPNKIPKAIPAATGMVWSKATGDFPSMKIANQ